MKKKILTIGAYERDNFGDLLFYIITKKYLTEYTVVPGAVSGADMRDLIGEIVLPYPALLESSHWDAIWVVGGEIGAASTNASIRMSITKEKETIYTSLSKKNQLALDELYNYNTNKTTIGYLPSLEKISTTTQLIVNSVGISGLSSMPNRIRNPAITSLAKSASVSVRDPDSSQYCKDINIQSVLSPDIVHTISRHFGVLTKPEMLPDNYIVFQMSEELASTVSVDNLAGVLDTIAEKYECSIVFFAAGTANYHDNNDVYHRLMKKLKCRTKLFLNRNPMKLAACIANSKIWLGTSLHGRIIAASYGVRRISFVNQKVTTYAKYWDGTQPYDIKIEDLKTATITALAVSDEDLLSVADNLAKQADTSTKKIVDEVLTL